MKKSTLYLSFAVLLCAAVSAHAEDAADANALGSVKPAEQAAAEAVIAAAPAAPAAPAMPEVPAEAVAAAPAVVEPAEEVAASENLEFVSGEVTAVNEAAKSLTVKLYGEADNQAAEKTLTVTTDANTDITDGEKDRDLKSLTPTTEVDVEFDPASSKATYIFVY